MANTTNTSLKVYVTKFESPTKTATKTVETNQKISLRIEPTNYSKSSNFDWEEAELLGFKENETFRLELQFEKEKVASFEVCGHLTAFFGLFVVPFFIVLPFFYCLKRSRKIQQDLSKIVLTNKRLITKNVENDICMFCFDCTRTQSISHWNIPWDRLSVTHIKVTEGCVDKCFKIKTLQIHNRDSERPAWVNITGLKDPDGIRKLLFRLRDENKAESKKIEEKIKHSAVNVMAKYNEKVKYDKNVAVVHDQGQQITYNQSTWQPPQEIKMKKRKSYENAYDYDYENEDVQDIEEEAYVDPEPEPEPEIEQEIEYGDGGGYDGSGGYDMNMDVAAYDMGGIGMDVPVFEFGAFM